MNLNFRKLLNYNVGQNLIWNGMLQLKIMTMNLCRCLFEKYIVFQQIKNFNMKFLHNFFPFGQLQHINQRLLETKISFSLKRTKINAIN